MSGAKVNCYNFLLKHYFYTLSTHNGSPYVYVLYTFCLLFIKFYAGKFRGKIPRENRKISIWTSLLIQKKAVHLKVFFQQCNGVINACCAFRLQFNRNTTRRNQIGLRADTFQWPETFCQVIFKTPLQKWAFVIIRQLRQTDGTLMFSN